MKMGFRQLFHCCSLLYIFAYKNSSSSRGPGVCGGKGANVQLLSNVQMLREEWFEKFKIPVETNSPAPVFLFLIAMYNDIKNMKQM